MHKLYLASLIVKETIYSIGALQATVDCISERSGLWTLGIDGYRDV